MARNEDGYAVAKQEDVPLKDLPTSRHSLLDSASHSGEEVDSGRTTPPVRPRPFSSFLSWKAQISSWIASLCFFLATIIFIRKLDGQRLPNMRMAITPNALIGLLASFMEFLLIVPVNSAFGQLKWLQALKTRPIDEFRTIDEASRGPWGSLILLVQRKGGYIGSFGALITVLALGISTFAQQTLDYVSVYPFTDNAHLPAARFLNGTGWANLGDVTAYCGTGNCTWEPYQTLAICNTCEDLTSQLERTTVHFEVPVEGFPPLEYDVYYYTLPNGFGLTGYDPTWEPDLPVWNGMLNITTTAPVSSSTHFLNRTQFADSIAFAHKGSKPMSIFAIGSLPGTIPVVGDHMKGSMFAQQIAFECVLQLCVRNMSAKFTNGRLEETEISTYVNQTQPVPNVWDLYPDMIMEPPGSSISFAAPISAWEAIGSWLSPLLVGNVTLLRNSGNWDLDFPVTAFSEITEQFYRTINRSATGFPDMMDNLAKSLSLNIRTIPYQPAPVRGKAFTSTSQAVVSWQWLVLPIIELIGSLVFLLVVMVQTRREGLAPWASNVLAYFFHGLDERPRRGHAYESQEMMENYAKDLKV